MHLCTFAIEVAWHLWPVATVRVSHSPNDQRFVMDIATVSFAICILITLGVGLLAARRGTESSTDYLLSGRDHGPIVTSLSASATDVSGWVLMGLVGMAYSTGLGVLWVIPAGLLGYALNWGLVARRIRAQSVASDTETFPAFLSYGFTPKTSAVIRLMASAIILVFLTYYVSGQFNAGGKALRTFFNIPYELGVVIALAISLPYVIVAGMRGTSWSDVVQAVLIAIAVVFVPIAALNQAGGFSELHSKLNSIDPNLVSLTAGNTGTDALLYIVFWLSIGLAYPGQPQILTRFMAARNDKAVTTGRWIAVAWFLLVASMAVVAGLAARVGFSDNAAIAQDSEQIIPALAAVFLPALLVGVVLAAVTAAIMSTADSMVLVLITTLLSDVRGKHAGSAKKYQLWSRVIVGTVVAVAAATLAFLAERKVFNVVLEAWAILGASFAPIVFYRLWAKRISSVAIVAGMVVGLLSAILLGGNYQIQIAGAMIASVVAISVAHLVTSSSAMTIEVTEVRLRESSEAVE